MTLSDFEGNISIKRPRYLILSIFEPYWLNQKFDFNEWIMNNSGLVKPVNAWFADSEQKNPILIIYEFNWENYQAENNSIF